MISLAFGLTLATYASAQVVSMIPNPNLAASGSASAASASSPMSSPPAATSLSSSDSSSASASPNQYNQYGSQYTSAPPQYTPPPQSEAMPYESFMNGGYKSMDCGYGYHKGSDAGCNSKESWVRTTSRNFTCDAIYAVYSILPRAAIRCIIRPRST